MDFNGYKINGKFKGYYAQTKFSNGQIGIIFFKKDILSKCTEFSVVFGISNKKKYIKQWMLGEKDMESYVTGKCGIEGLIWAKKAVLEFEEFIKNRYSHSRIVVMWADAKRKKVYKRYLEKEGYRFCRYYGVEALIKDIIKKEKMNND